MIDTLRKRSFCGCRFYYLHILRITGRYNSLTERPASVGTSTDISFISMFVHLRPLRPKTLWYSVTLVNAEYPSAPIPTPPAITFTSSSAPQYHQPHALSASQFLSSVQRTTYLLHSFRSKHKRMFFLYTYAILNANAHTAEMSRVCICVGDVDATVGVLFSSVLK